MTGRPFTNTELNNTFTVTDLLVLAQSPPARSVMERRKETIEEKLNGMSLPPNMHWVPSQRTLREQLAKRGADTS